MPEHGYAIKELDEIFDFSISTNSGLTKSFVNSNKGTVPVYGASQDVDNPSYGYIKDNIEGIKYFDDCLTYNKDGASGMTFYRKGHFTISEKVVPLVIFEKYKGLLDYNYLKYAIEFEARKQQYTFSNKATKITFKKLKIKIPLNIDKEFDIEKQHQLAIIYADIEEKRKSLISQLSQISSAAIKIVDAHASNFKISEIYKDLQRGKSCYTKTYCKDHKGVYPVYSATNLLPLGNIDSFDYDGAYVTISVNGIAGKITIIDGKFSTNADRVVLTLKENIDIQYFKYVAEPILRSSIKGRIGEKGKNEYTKITPDKILNVTISIPLKDNGDFDIEAQKTIAQKYDQIEQIKKQLFDRITELTNIVVA